MKDLVVLKVGTKNLMTRSRLDQDIFNDIARQVVAVEGQGKRVLIVSSGAIQAGRERMKELDIDLKYLTKKDLAGPGSRHLLNKWGEAFSIYRKDVSQFWVTYANWQNSEEIENIKVELLNCFGIGLIPIINENDVISDKEIVSMEKGFSENDRLARMVAQLIRAEAILFLTDAGGIYEEDPQTNPRARMYQELNPFIFEAKEDLPRVSKLGRGGIKVKIAEAKICYLAGMKVAIAGTEEPDVLIKFCRGEKVGTTLSKFSKFK